MEKLSGTGGSGLIDKMPRDSGGKKREGGGK